MITLVNWRQEEPIGYGGGRQPSMGGTSRISREAYVRICERLGVKFPGATRRWETGGRSASVLAPILDSTGTWELVEASVPTSGQRSLAGTSLAAETSDT